MKKGYYVQIFNEDRTREVDHRTFDDQYKAVEFIKTGEYKDTNLIAFKGDCWYNQQIGMTGGVMYGWD